MAVLEIDFLHNYVLGQRRESVPIAYQYDEGHEISINVPDQVTSAELHYWIQGVDEAGAYTPASISQEADGSYTIAGNIPNLYFEHHGDLHVYVAVTDDDTRIINYEGHIIIKQRAIPDDYAGDNPSNGASSVIGQAEAWATGQINGEDVDPDADQYENNSKYWAEQAASAAGQSIPVGTITLTTSWTTSNGVHSQVVAVPGVLSTSKIDLQPDVTALEQMLSDGTSALWAVNNAGVVTVYALGTAPTAALTVQYTKMEVGVS